MRGKHWMSYIEVDFTTVVVGVTLSARSRAKMAKQCQAAAAQANTKPRATLERQLDHTSAKPSGEAENAIPVSRTGSGSQAPSDRT
jgi:hypothetical protein